MTSSLGIQRKALPQISQPASNSAFPAGRIHASGRPQHSIVGSAPGCAMGRDDARGRLMSVDYRYAECTHGFFGGRTARARPFTPSHHRARRGYFPGFSSA